jgi:tRNA(fMet)-specific endonuclease VapC
MQIRPYDQMIADHARSRGLIVVTRNTSEFQRVAGFTAGRLDSIPF